MEKLTKTLIASLLLAAPVASHAAVVTQYTGGTGSLSDAFVGQSFTTPLDSFYGDLSFSFLDGATPKASGTAYILSELYTGSPEGLSTSTPGFLGDSVSATRGAYTFGSTLTLAPGTTYYLYEDTRLGTISDGAGYTGGYLSLAVAADGSFGTAPGTSFDFTLSGTPVPVPEPSTYVMAGAGALALFAVQRIRRGAGRR